MGCGLCTEVCGDHALKMVERDAAELVVPDPEAEKKAEEKRRAHEEAERAKAKMKRTLNKAMDQMEKLG